MRTMILIIIAVIAASWALLEAVEVYMQARARSAKEINDETR